MIINKEKLIKVLIYYLQKKSLKMINGKYFKKLLM